MTVFSAKTVVVTGAASGIGLALCRALLARGAVVFAADCDAGGLAKLEQWQLPQAREAAGANKGMYADRDADTSGGCAVGSLCTRVVDVSQEQQVKTLLKQAQRSTGRLDYVFNNAGIVVGGDFENMTTDQWRRIVDINVMGVAYGSLYAYQMMLAQGHGHIVNTSSSAGFTPVAKSTAYAATKHAVVGLSSSLREEGRGCGVRVSVVAPGLVDTNVFGSAINTQGFDYDASIQKLPVKKISAEAAARHILRGVRRNRAVIVFPFYNRLLLGLYRWFPRLMGRIINTQTVSAKT